MTRRGGWLQKWVIQGCYSKNGLFQGLKISRPEEKKRVDKMKKLYTCGRTHLKATHGKWKMFVAWQEIYILSFELEIKTLRGSHA